MSSGGRGGELAERLAANTGISFEKADDLFKSFWEKFTSGEITEEGVWEYIESRIGQKVPADKRTIWNTWEHTGVQTEMKKLVLSLREKGYIVGLLSNVIPPTAKEIRKHGGYDLFDFCVLSCEVGVSKPQPGIYQIAMEKLDGVQPSEVVFIDDIPPFVEAAGELGIQTILAKSTEQVALDIQKLLQV